MLNINDDVTMIVPIKASDFQYVEKLIPLVTQNLHPKRIIVISANDIQAKCIALGIDFIDENKMIPNLNFNILKQKLIDLHIDTKATGWYLQQFLKLGFANICKTKYYVTWDADMLPIRPISFFNPDGRPYLTLKKEYMHRYFLTLKRLLNIDKVRKESFIAEHMIFNVPLVQEMLSEIENNDALRGTSWWEKILYATLPESHRDAFAFSEFETFGNWVTQKHTDAYVVRKLQMLRHAKYFFGATPMLSDIKWAAKSFDTLSFEHFDTQIISPKWQHLAKSLISFKMFLRLTCLFLPKVKKQALQEFDWFFCGKLRYEKLSDAEKSVKNADKIKILFDATLLNEFNSDTKSRTGIYFVSFNMLKCLVKHQNIQVFLYSSNMQRTKEFINYYNNEIPNLLLFSGDVLNMDLYLSSFFQIPDNIRATGIPCCSIIHDCIPLVLPGYQEINKHWFPKLINSLTNQDYCFANSNHTKQDFLKYCPQLDANKIFVIPLSTNVPLKPNRNLTKSIMEKYKIPVDNKYIFSLCSLEPRKNLIRSVRCFIKFIAKHNIQDLVFVLGGGAYDGFIELFEKNIPEYNKYKNKIIRAGYINDTDLEVLYSNAEWFVYTSQYEGFGMPPLEAMSCACPVITSNNSSLPEVVGDAGIMIDYDNDQQHIAAYEKYYFDKKYRNKMAKHGLKRSRLFSWDEACNIMIDAFKKIEYNPNRTSLFLQNNPKTNIHTVKLLHMIPVGTFQYDNKMCKFTLFNLIQLFKFTVKNNTHTLKLFGRIPVYKYANTPGRLQCLKLFGVPLVRICMKNDAKKYYILSIPVLKLV